MPQHCHVQLYKVDFHLCSTIGEKEGEEEGGRMGGRKRGGGAKVFNTKKQCQHKKIHLKTWEFENAGSNTFTSAG